MPVNWTHYIGIDLDRCDEAVQRLRDDPSIVARVGAAGRAWALTHYGPTAIARRLLDLVAARE
jgi:glycosyltransferase involved in cell wall biosynthesis